MAGHALGWVRWIVVAVVILGVVGCDKAIHNNTLGSAAAPATPGQYEAEWSILDFESPEPEVAFSDVAPATRPAAETSVKNAPRNVDLFAEKGMPQARIMPRLAPMRPVHPRIRRRQARVGRRRPLASGLSRTARAPAHGLWALETHISEYGQLLHRFKKPTDLRKIRNFCGRGACRIPARGMMGGSRRRRC